MMQPEITKKNPIEDALSSNGIVILPPQDVMETLKIVNPVKATIIDPWYNKGIGGVRTDYFEFLGSVVRESSKISEHMFVWGFPEIVYKILDNLPVNFELAAWLTWYYKNLPSVNRGWRSAQFACLHIAKKGAKLYPEHFMNEKQLEKKKQGKLRYIPGPPSVIEVPLLIGWCGKKEQIGKPSLTCQKPVSVIEPLILMSTEEGDKVLDPMCGTGTTGVVCRKLKRLSILCDQSEERTKMTEGRLGIKRLSQR